MHRMQSARGNDADALRRAASPTTPRKLQHAQRPSRRRLVFGPMCAHSGNRSARTALQNPIPGVCGEFGSQSGAVQPKWPPPDVAVDVWHDNGLCARPVGVSVADVRQPGRPSAADCAARAVYESSAADERGVIQPAACDYAGNWHSVLHSCVIVVSNSTHLPECTYSYIVIAKRSVKIGTETGRTAKITIERSRRGRMK